MTPTEVMTIMLVEGKNELTRCELQERVHQRIMLKATGHAKEMGERLMAENQAKIRYLKMTLPDMEDILKDELKKDQAAAVSPGPAAAAEPGATVEG